MKKLRLIVSLVLVMCCLCSLSAVSAGADSGLARAKDIFDPYGPSREEEELRRMQELLDQLAYEAWCCYEYMAIPNLRDMLREPEIRYVQGSYGQGIYAKDEPSGEQLRVLAEGTRLTVYARHGGHAFVRTDDGYVCWCRSDLIVKSFNQELSLMRLWNWQYENGIPN